MCFAGPSMGNSADADQMSPDSLLNEVYLYPELISNHWPQVLHVWRYEKLTILSRLLILKANLTEC